MIKLCKYCFNDAETMSYRERDGQVSKEIVCNKCHSLTNEAIAKFDKRNKSNTDWNQLQLEIEIQAIKLAISRVKGSGMLAEEAELQYDHLTIRLSEFEQLKHLYKGKA